MYFAKKKPHWMIHTSLLTALILLWGTAAGLGPPAVVHADAPEPPSIQSEFYVDPVYGLDSNDGMSELTAFQTIARAQSVVRTENSQMTGDIIVYLRGGAYNLTQTLEFTEQDSGNNGHRVVYSAYPEETPVLSGGESIGGWQIHDVDNNIYKAPVDAGLNSRQLFVNGNRATRARSAEGLPDSALVEHGIATSNTDIASWGNISDLELVWKQSWTNPRGTIDYVTVDGATAVLHMKQPGWSYLTNKGGTSVTVPWYYENAYELLDEEGEWYLDRTVNFVYYKPLPDENMAEAEVIMPVLEQLVSLKGTDWDLPVHDIHFEGISFQHTTWLAPGSEQAHPDVQSNVLRMRDPVTNAVEELLTPAAVEISMGQRIHFERCSFSRLGSSAVNITQGSQDNLLRGNVFMDLSGSGVQVGEVNRFDSDYYNPIDPRKWLRNNDIVNNFFYKVGVEYRSSVPVFAAYPRDMDISHNEISSTPYSGITVGWGWGAIDTGNSGNRIENNYIHHVMQELADGGAIYTLGTSRDIRINNNYIREQKHNFGSIYLDEGSSHIIVRDNVMENIQIPIFVNTEAHHISVEGTYADNFQKVNAGKSTVVIEDMIYTPDSNWSVAAQSIIDAAGIEEAYRDIIPDVSDPGTSEEPPGEAEPEPLPVEFQGKKGLIAGIQKAGTVRNNWSGWVGMQITIGNSPLSVTALGRVDLGNSLGVHRLRIVDAATGTDLLDPQVRLVMDEAAANGGFKYVQLASPVTLQANQSYYLLSEEKVGEDLWYDSDLKVQTSNAATADIGIWSDTFRQGSVSGNSFAGLDLLYEAGALDTPAPVSLPQPEIAQPDPEPEPLPLQLENTASAIAQMTPGTLRNDWSGWVGMQFTVGAERLPVTALGRLFAPGNSAKHDIMLVDAASDVIIAKTRISMEEGTAGQFNYGQLPETVWLTPGKSYLLLSLEESGGDYWHNGDTVASAASVITIDKAISSSNDRNKLLQPYRDGYLSGNMYAGVDLRYSTEELPVLNLLHNGGFEHNDYGWTARNASLSRVTNVTYNGGLGAARVKVTGDYGSPLQNVTLEKYKLYEVSVWVKLDSGTDAAQIILDHGAGTPRYTYLAANTEVDTAWKQLKATFKYTGTNSNANAVVQLRIGNGQTRPVYYFDDFVVREAHV